MYVIRSVLTISFWKYALLSKDALLTLFAIVGGLYGFLEMLDFFSIYTRDNYARYAIVPVVLLAVVIVVFTRRPVKKVFYRAPRKDLWIEVRVGDLFEGSGDVVISTNTTFDTRMSDGLIASDSLQGQFAQRFFNSNTAEIDRQLDVSLAGVPFSIRDGAPGKQNEYAIGTTAAVKTHGRTFYFVAMGRLNHHGTAKSTVRNIEDALEGLWRFISERGERRDFSIPLMGTGRGRIELPRKKIAERIAQSFIDASREKIFSNKMTIYVSPHDADVFEINLFEIRDYLRRSLHV